MRGHWPGRRDIGWGRVAWCRGVIAVGLALVLASACTSGGGGDGAGDPGQGSRKSNDAGSDDQPSDFRASDEIREAVTGLAERPDVTRGLALLEADAKARVQDQIELTEIPSPPFGEKVRGDEYAKRLTAAGVRDVRRDSEGNVFGTLPGAQDGPTIFISAHLDTVFPKGTDVSVKKKEGRLHAPGIGDDGAGLAALLSVARAVKETGIATRGTVIIGGTVGEEGEGDLRGVKAFFEQNADVDAFISVDGTEPGRVTYQATGSHRFKISFPGPGGHSFGAFGTPSSIHAMGRAIAEISDLKVPEDPKTTFTVGVVDGGTSVNAIAGEASMLVDIRSNAEEEITKVEKKVRAIVDKAAKAENQRWDASAGDGVSVRIEQIGDRPAGSQEPDTPLVETAWSAAAALELPTELSDPSSTDSNQPMSLGIPAITIGGGGDGDGSHSEDEWYDPKDSHLGTQRILLTALALAGIDGADGADGAPPTQPKLPS